MTIQHRQFRRFSGAVRVQVLAFLLLATSCTGPSATGSHDQLSESDTTASEGDGRGCKINLQCEDGDPCTKHECVDGQCTFISYQDGNQCDDANPCTVGDQCDNQGNCAGENKQCDDGNTCTSDSCNSESGACEFAAQADGAQCQDGAACTKFDACTDGICIGDPVQCDDSQPDDCVYPACESATGECTRMETHVENFSCQDDNPCTLSDECDAKGNCIPGELRKCDTPNPCQDAWCDDAASPNENPCKTSWINEGISCDDGDTCTEFDQCKLVADGPNLKCSGTPLDCDDSNSCTTDVCDEEAGCLHDSGAKQGAVCHDAEGKCGLCDEGTCVLDPDMCDDGKICTDDQCNSSGECYNAPLTGPECDDGKSCTLDDVCLEGLCTGTGMVCSDGNVCTIDFCTDGECQYSSVPNGTDCNDGDPCSVGDHCSEGICITGGYSPDCLDSCGDGKCIYPDTPVQCPIDCGYCGDDTCSYLELGPAGGSCPVDCLAVCGDGECQGGESDLTCAIDCSGCGDGICGLNESEETCLGDCPMECGNGKCEPFEGPTTCPADCLPPCGNGICNWGESPYNCVQDCSLCGDGYCSLDETTQDCLMDCEFACGNGQCQTGETAVLCPQDCGPCGDNTCGVNETAENCPSDCPEGCGNGICGNPPGEELATCPADCLVDADGDEIYDNEDNCPHLVNVGQKDTDDDGSGDTCDPDDDGDGELDVTDCKPLDAEVSHLVTEVCDDKDNDCDGDTDEGNAEGCETYYIDVDGDGFGEEWGTKCLCQPDDLYGATVTGDCAHTDPDVFPGANEVCNGKDDNCDSNTDDGADLPGCIDWYQDNDKDGYGVTATKQCLCTQPDGYVPDPGDCDDLAKEISPDATEICNGQDDNCNGPIDEEVDCSDGFACTVDSCGADDGCIHIPSDINCDDNNPCTQDTCLIDFGCQWIPTDNTSCDDNNICNGIDICWGGVCSQVGGGPDCNDDNPCTDDSCIPATGCHYAPNDTIICGDDPCTDMGTCDAGECQAAPIDCDDENECTDDVCITFSGCMHTEVELGTPCQQDIAALAYCNQLGECTCTPDCDGTDCEPDGCGERCPGDCIPDIGDIVFTEIFVTGENSDSHQWFELYNSTNQMLSLESCKIDPGSGFDYVMTAGSNPDKAWIPAGERVVVAKGWSQQNDPFQPDLVLLGMTQFAQSTYTLTCDGTICDQVSTEPEWHFTGASLQLDSAFSNASDNDTRLYWCPGQDTYGQSGELGSPGEPNNICNCTMYEFAVQMEGGYGELSPNVHLDIDAFTVELWARVNTLKNATLIGRWDEEPGVYADCSYRIAIMSNGTLRFDIVKWDNGFIEFDTAWASGLIGPGKTIPLDTWFHVAVVIDNHDVRLYANGTLEANSITDQLAHDPAAPALRIAAHMALSPPAWPEGTNYFDGDLDEIRISYHAVYSGDSFIPETEYSDVPNTQLYYGKDTADHPSLQTGSGTCSPGCKAQVSYGGPACMGPE